MCGDAASSISYTQIHDGVDNVVIERLQSLNGLLSRHVGLCHHQLDILGLNTGLVDLLTIIFLLLLLLLVSGSLGSLALVGSSILVGVVVTGVVVSSSRLSGSELLSGGSLSLGVEVLNLGLTEDAADCAV